MIVAAIDGDWVVPLLVVVIGFINWISGKLKSAGAPTPTVRPTPPARSRTAETSEEERMRKFLEALGVPSDAPPVPAKPIPRQPPPLRPEARKPVRQVVAREVKAPPPLPIEPSLDEESAPSLPVEQFTLPSFVVPEFQEFTTVSSTIGAIPTERPITATAIADAPARSDLLRYSLASREQLRSAFLLREILGPPRSLQSEAATPNLRAL